MTFTVGPARPRPGKVRPRPGPQSAKSLLTSPGPARACKFQAHTRPGPQNIIEAWPGPAHGLRAGPARAGPYHGPSPKPRRKTPRCLQHNSPLPYSGRPLARLRHERINSYPHRTITPNDNNPRTTSLVPSDTSAVCNPALKPSTF